MTNLLELINSGVTDVTVNVKLADLVELIKQTIEAAKAELLPAMVSAAQEVLLTKKEVMEKFGVPHHPMELEQEQDSNSSKGR